MGAREQEEHKPKHSIDSKYITQLYVVIKFLLIDLITVNRLTHSSHCSNKNQSPTH